jgi:hypothetical protein
MHTPRFFFFEEQDRIKHIFFIAKNNTFLWFHTDIYMFFTFVQRKSAEISDPPLLSPKKKINFYIFVKLMSNILDLLQIVVKIYVKYHGNIGFSFGDH